MRSPRRSITSRDQRHQAPRGKLPLDITLTLKRIRDVATPFKKAAMFELAERGHDSLFEQLIACIISIRTFDEMTIPYAERLFTLGRTPQQIVNIPVAEIQNAIKPCTFYLPKGVQIQAIARQVVEEYNGTLPCDRDVLLSFKGVGPKCANLALGIACRMPLISVDIHVHRVTNRWGYVSTSTPEKTITALAEVLPKKYWIEINRLLVPFGKHICTGVRPKCSACPVLEMCRQVGVTDQR